MGKLNGGLILFFLINIHVTILVGAYDYGDALTKSILFFEGQRSGKLPASQRLTWRKDSALRDGSDVGVDLVGGYYDAGDNIKFHFPMAFSITMLSWSVLEFGKFMGPDEQHALDAIRWGTDYFLKATAKPGIVYAQVGEPYGDHNCWERPEDMDTPRNSYAVTTDKPGSEVSAETAAALAAASLAFKTSDLKYSDLLLERAATVFEFADKNRGSYNNSIGRAVCPFYCDFDGYQDELLWGATWLYKATKEVKYWNYVKSNATTLGNNFNQFGWDAKFAGVNLLASKLANSTSDVSLFVSNVNKLVCFLLPESPTKKASYTPGGLLHFHGATNLQNVASQTFLMVVYADYLSQTKTTLNCSNVAIDSTNLIHFANSQVDYVLGKNPMNMSYMVGFGDKFPQMIHHRGSTVPSVDSHPSKIPCKNTYFDSPKPNPNQLTGAIVGGPEFNDKYADARVLFNESEPTTYINAPFVGTLAFLKSIQK